MATIAGYTSPPFLRELTPVAPSTARFTPMPASLAVDAYVVAGLTVLEIAFVSCLAAARQHLALDDLAKTLAFQ